LRIGKKLTGEIAVKLFKRIQQQRVNTVACSQSNQEVKIKIKLCNFLSLIKTGCLLFFKYLLNGLQMLDIAIQCGQTGSFSTSKNIRISSGLFGSPVSSRP
jgi:hypothetical protein